ncbi:hypothetical protein Fot_42834 [Forsythia ovata]|uniref:Hydroxyproline O-arabinosyltransferase-like domain-containing protein n=1 Tax=Forsythia ovata TaxID=205694 RepID=A0ABD1RMA6_9LAMI
MGGFTRILHYGHPDRFKDETPTFVAQPLPSGIHHDALLNLAPTWMNVSLAMKKDPRVDIAFVWVPEMQFCRPLVTPRCKHRHAYAVASALEDQTRPVLSCSALLWKKNAQLVCMLRDFHMNFHKEIYTFNLYKALDAKD